MKILKDKVNVGALVGLLLTIAGGIVTEVSNYVVTQNEHSTMKSKKK